MVTHQVLIRQLGVDSQPVCSEVRRQPLFCQATISL